MANGTNVTLASAEAGRAATLLLDMTPAPCGFVAAVGMRGLTLRDLDLQAVRPASTLAYFGAVAADNRSFTLTVAPTVNASCNYSFAGLASGAHPWLGAIETLQPVERCGPLRRDWRYVVPVARPGAPVAQYVWRKPYNRLPVTSYEPGARVLTVAFDDSGSLRSLPAEQPFVVRHVVYGNDGVYALGGSNISLTRVRLYATAGMGFHFDFAHNVVLSQVGVLAPAGRPFSISADAVHCISCTGAFDVHSSVFENHGDDGLNVHGQLELVEGIQPPDTITVQPGWTSALLLAPLGTPYRFRNSTTLEVLGERDLLAIESNGPTVRARFTSLPPGLAVGDSLIAAGLAPATNVVNCTWRNCRCRGAILSTGQQPVTVADSSFLGTTKSAVILIDGAVSPDCFLEGPFSQRVLLQNNTIVLQPNGYLPSTPAPPATLFQSAGAVQVAAGTPVRYANGSLNVNQGILVTHGPPVYGNLTLLNNRIVLGQAPQWVAGEPVFFPRAAVHAGSLASLVLANNTISGNQAPYDVCAFDTTSVSLDASNHCPGRARCRFNATSRCL